MTGKFALVIGNSEYEDSRLAQLTAPGKDAEDLARVLQSPDYCAFDDVRVLKNQPEPVVREAVDEFFEGKSPDDLLLLYFSGHGVRDELGALYLAVKNTNRARLRSTAIKSDFIQEAMEQSRARRQVLILDCCNSGAFQQGTKAATGGSIGVASAFGGTGRIILTASDALQYAWQGDAVMGNTANSLFTHFLVEGLKGDAENDGDGVITVDELYDYAYEQVRRATPNQTPSKFSSKQEGEIVLRQITRLDQIKAAPLPDPLIESMENPIASVRLGAVQELARLVKGKNLSLARSAREALEKLAAEDDSYSVRKAGSDALAPIREVEEQEKKQEEEQRLAAEKAKAERAEAARLAALKVEEERLAAEKAAAERAAQQKAERERRKREKAERERLAELQAQQELAARERAEQEEAEQKRLAEVKLQQERAARLRREKTEEERRQRAEAEAAEALVARTGQIALKPAIGARSQTAPRRSNRTAFLYGSGAMFSIVILGIVAVLWFDNVQRQRAAAEATQVANAVNADATGTADANYQATSTALAQQTQSAASTEYAAAQATSTAAAVATATARDQFFTEARAQALRVFNPTNGTLTLDSTGQHISWYHAGVTLTNFFAIATFFNPYPTSKGPWDYGFTFRNEDTEKQYRIILSSAKRWALQNWTGSVDTVKYVENGPLSSLDVSDNGSNTVWLICRGSMGQLYVNGNFVADLDLSDRMTAGDVTVAAGMYTADEIGGQTAYTSFTVWSLP